MPKRAAYEGAGVLPPLRADDPTSVGRYRIEGRLGSGGMGTVFLAHDPDGRPVAVKVIRSDLAADPEFRGRFADEVAAARRVKPFCTAQVLDADPHARRPYLVTEYIDGKRLDQVVSERGPLPLSTLQGVAVGVASALTAIHGAGIVHRDLKPSNVLLSYSGPRVIDFGIARALDGLDGRTRSGLVMGSAGWMAPEQMQGRHVGPAADVFAWGILIAYGATGRHPYGEGSYAEVAERIMYGHHDLTGVPPELRGIVTLALARTPADRPTAESVLLALLGDRGKAGNARRAATEVIDGTWPRAAAAFGAAAGGGYPDPTRVAPPSFDASGRDGARSGFAAGGSRQVAPPPPLPQGGRRRGYVQYPEDAAAARPPSSAPPAPAGPAPYGAGRPEPRPAPRQQYRPPPPAPPPVPAARPPAPYREPAPRRRRRRLRIPFKKTIIFVILVLFLLSAADQIASMVDEQRERLWEKAVESVQDFVDQKVDEVQGRVEDATDQQRDDLQQRVDEFTGGAGDPSGIGPPRA